MDRIHTALVLVLLFSVTHLERPSAAQQETGWYTGGSIGLTNYRIQRFDDVVELPNESVDFEETVFNYKVLFGRRVNRDLAFELSLADHGSANGPLSEGRADSGDELRIDEHAATAYVTGFLPLGNHYLPELEHVELFGQAGPAWVRQEVDVDATDGSGQSIRTTRTDNGVGLGVGIGFNLYMTKRLALRGEMHSIFAQPTDLDDAMGTERIIGFVGLQYNFHDLPASD